MTKFQETEAAEQFIASADSRETSREIMEAIAFFARDIDEAEQLWNGNVAGICNPGDIWEHVTNNGRRDPHDFVWGAARDKWWEGLS